MREGWREGGREGGDEGRREGWREGGREGGKVTYTEYCSYLASHRGEISCL